MERVLLRLNMILLHRMAGFALLPATWNALPACEGVAAGVLARRARAAAAAGGDAVQPGRVGRRPASGQGQGEEAPESDLTCAPHGLAAHVIWSVIWNRPPSLGKHNAYFQSERVLAAILMDPVPRLRLALGCNMPTHAYRPRFLPRHAQYKAWLPHTLVHMTLALLKTCPDCPPEKPG